MRLRDLPRSASHSVHGETDGQDALFGVVGSDISFQSVGAVQPHLEIGYEFPLDQGARNQMQWGILAQFFLEF
jgi:hypothetical protein